MWTLFLANALAGEPCAVVPLKTATHLPAPAVILLGERKGHHPDLLRAEKIITKLAKRSSVTVALESVHRDHQGILTKYEAGQLSPTDLPELLHWNDYWGFDYWRYERIVTASVVGANVYGVGLDWTIRPNEVQVPIPPGYIHVLGDIMGTPAPVDLEGRFVQMVAYRDFSIAKAATEAWNGDGYLVILADRLHVEGGLGISWQLARLTDAPVTAFVLSDASSPCYDGDLLFK